MSAEGQPIRDRWLSDRATDPDATILVVDDRAEDLLALRTILEDPGYRLVTAQSGREALLEVLRQDFAVILLDAHMPGMDGLEFRDVQLADPRLAAIPVIALTADAHVSRCAQELRVRDYLGKPIDVDRLLALVALHCADCASARRRRWSTG